MPTAFDANTPYRNTYTDLSIKPRHHSLAKSTCKINSHAGHLSSLTWLSWMTALPLHCCSPPSSRPFLPPLSLPSQRAPAQELHQKPALLRAPPTQCYLCHHYGAPNAAAPPATPFLLRCLQISGLSLKAGSSSSSSPPPNLHCPVLAPVPLWGHFSGVLWDSRCPRQHRATAPVVGISKPASPQPAIIPWLPPETS